MKLFDRPLKRATNLMQQAGLDAIALVPGPNFAYLTGVHLHLMERPTLFVLRADGHQFAVMPQLERLKWSAAMPAAATFYWQDEAGPAAAFKQLSAALQSERLGVEGLRMRAAEYLQLLHHWPQQHLVDADNALSELRLCKDAAEIAQLKKAIAISETALAETLDAFRIGQTERAIAARLKIAMLSHGASGFSFDPIVLAGAEAANPHGSPAERATQPGQVLLIDFGASFEDMHADITRTVFCQHVTDQHAAVYETVKAANQAGKDAIRVDEPIENVDTAATAVLKNSPYADLIVHKTGHGLGRDVHEAPQVMQGSRTAMTPGMVFTVEPGLYRPGDLGVRIEDDVLVTATGYESLTTFSRDLMIIG